MSTASNYVNGHPFTPIWSTSDRQQTTSKVSNLTPSSDYYFYIIASGGGGGVSSNLLEVQTLPIPTLSPNPTPSPSPTVPEFPIWTILLLVTLMMSSGLLVYHKKHKRKFSQETLTKTLLSTQSQAVDEENESNCLPDACPIRISSNLWSLQWSNMV